MHKSMHNEFTQFDNSGLLSRVNQPNQIELFEKELEMQLNTNLDHTSFKKRGYTVNDKASLVEDSKIQTIGFFSGAGGLDIGSQLAGSKVISSLDFDKDSVSTMKANKYFAHTKHFLSDIKAVNAKTFTNIIKENNSEKLVLGFLN